MTDEPPTDLGEIVVVGQRRSEPWQPFPERPVPQDWEPEFDELPPADDGPLDPCFNPETALPWNADAAGAKSVDAFLSKAATLGEANLSAREFGRGLARGPNNSVWGNAVTAGPDRNPAPGSVSNVIIVMDPITFDNYIGDAHSHPNSNPYPSQEDWDGFISNNNIARARPGRANDTFYMYITVVEADGSVGKTYVYQDGPRPVGSPDPLRPTTLGDEVNPNAEPCP